MNRYLVHINGIAAFGMRSDSIYEVERYVKSDFVTTSFCISLLG
jgi:hypothetical protein